MEVILNKVSTSLPYFIVFVVVLLVLMALARFLFEILNRPPKRLTDKDIRKNNEDRMRGKLE